MSSLLAKLNPKSSNMMGLPGGGGEDITAADVSAAMSEIKDPLQYHLMMARGAELHPNPEQLQDLLGRVKSILVKMWIEGNGNSTLARDRLALMAHAVWSEVIVGGYTDKERAVLVKMNRVSWSRNKALRELYYSAYTELESRYFDGLRKISKKIG
jgi:hypothetical protein